METIMSRSSSQVGGLFAIGARRRSNRRKKEEQERAETEAANDDEHALEAFAGIKTTDRLCGRLEAIGYRLQAGSSKGQHRCWRRLVEVIEEPSSGISELANISSSSSSNSSGSKRGRSSSKNSGKSRRSSGSSFKLEDEDDDWMRTATSASARTASSSFDRPRSGGHCEKTRVKLTSGGPVGQQLEGERDKGEKVAYSFGDERVRENSIEFDLAAEFSQSEAPASSSGSCSLSSSSRCAPRRRRRRRVRGGCEDWRSSSGSEEPPSKSRSRLSSSRTAPTFGRAARIGPFGSPGLSTICHTALLQLPLLLLTSICFINQFAACSLLAKSHNDRGQQTAPAPGEQSSTLYGNNYDKLEALLRQPIEFSAENSRRHQRRPEAEAEADAEADADAVPTRLLDLTRHRQRENHPTSGVHIAHNRRHERRKSGKRRRRHQTSYQQQHHTISQADRPIVITKKGLVTGVTKKLFTGKFVDAFLGIPYAQPPVGKYRFRHPQETLAWSGELDASRFASSCYQVNDTFFGSNFLGTSVWNANTPLSEDCLYLNIWSPFGAANTTVFVNSSDQNNNNIRIPASSSSASQPALRPVLVWIFGGGFYSGTSTLALYEGGVLASEEDIIVVSMNYRVSALGFLYLGRPEAPGNAGLFDQLMALQWIRNNIDQFGGDPNRVTIFGESAGAVSIAFHLLSPLSRDLFSQAILQSGAATCPWGYKEPHEIITTGLQLASLLNCPSNNSDLNAALECLLKADPYTLVSQEVGQPKNILNFPFVPVIDGSFLVESPIESLAKSNFKQAKILLGSNFDEGNAFLIYMPEFSSCPASPSSSSSSSPLPLTAEAREQTNANEQSSSAGDEKSLKSMDLVAATGRQQYSSQSQAQQQQQQQSIATNNEDQLAGANNQQNQSESKPCKPNDLLSFTRDDFLRVLRDGLNPHVEHPIAREAIVFEYSNWNNPQDSVSNYDALDKLVGDYYFTCHVNEFALRYANAGNQVYMYYFKQRSSISPWPKWMGVLHGDEINFIFGEPLNQNQFNYTANEIELSKRMMKYWGNFARYGNPTKSGENKSMAERWPEYADKRQYLELHGDFARIGRGPRAKQCAFWAHYLPKLVETFDKSQCAPFQGRPSFEQTGSYFNQPAQTNTNTNPKRSSGLFAFVPSSALVSVSVILALALIIALLAYAKQSWKTQLLGFTASGDSAMPQTQTGGAQATSGSQQRATQSSN